MDYMVFADKLLDLSKGHAGTIAEQWYNAISTNAKTPSFRTVPRQKPIAFAVHLLDNLKKIYFTENPYEEIQDYIEHSRYFTDILNAKVPLAENIYSLVLLRRQIWLYADTQAMFNTALDMYQAIESINRTILLFDYMIFILTGKYTVT